jgi:hypothetical protein
MADTNAATEKPSLAARAEAAVKRAGTAVKDGWNNFRVGDGHFTAWLRQGFKELTHMLLPAFPGGQHIVEEPGLFGNPTQGEVASSREEDPAARQRVAGLNEEPMRRKAAVRSPSEIADSKERQQGQQPGQQQGQSQSQSRGRGRGM